MSADGARPRRLVLLRHGRTDWNASGRVQGQLESELDETGHRQAADAAVALARLGPVALWSSDSARARQTASYVAKEAGLEPVYDARLREYFLADWQGLTHRECAERFPEDYDEYRRGNFDVVPGGEKNAEVADRMTTALHELLASIAPGECAVAVSHGAAIRDAVPALVSWPRDRRSVLHGLANCGWADLDQAEPGGPLRLTAYNRVTGA